MEPITNEAGQVAIKWAIERRNPQTLKIDGTEIYYVPESRFHVAMIWIDPQYLDRALKTKAKSCACAGGTYVNGYVLANQIDVNLWLYGDRHGKPEVKEN